MGKFTAKSSKKSSRNNNAIPAVRGRFVTLGATSKPSKPKPPQTPLQRFWAWADRLNARVTQGLIR